MSIIRITYHVRDRSPRLYGFMLDYSTGYIRYFRLKGNAVSCYVKLLLYMIYIGSDHGGFDLKEKIKGWLKTWGYEFEDLGNTLYEAEDDYPQFAFKLAGRVAEEEAGGKRYPLPWKERPKGILTCRSAAGMVIAANKIPGARAVTAFNIKSAKHSRMHNDANVLALSGDWLEEYQAQKIIRAWITTEFSGEERHMRRIKEIEEREKILLS